MIVTMFYHGGSGYAVFDTSDPRDAEQFPSFAAAKAAFAARLHDSYYPCVSDCTPEDGGPEAWICYGPSKENLGRDYPDLLLSFGPRGGVRVTPA